MTDEIQKGKNNTQLLLFIDRMMDTVDIIVTQITSGRWLLTVAAGVCLLHIAFSTDDKAKILDIIKDIIIFYFVVRDNKPAADTAPPKPLVDLTKAIPGEVKV